MRLYKTSEILRSDDYPYGRLRSTAFFSVEFKKGKGFRSVFQTINPKTGRLNAPKKGVYHKIMLPAQEDNGHYTWYAREFYSGEKVTEVCQFLRDNFDLFTTEQMESIVVSFISYLNATAKAQVIYCGSDAKKVLEVMDETVTKAVKGLKDKANFWGDINYPHNELESLKVEGYNPFKVTNAGV